MLEQLKERVLQQNLALVRHGLVVLTWGNVSAIDRENGLVVIKPSGVAYDTMKADDMVVVDMDGKVVEGRYRPSSDLPTHLALYRAYPEVGGVVHTHSNWATVFSQAGKSIPPLGTTHADVFYGEIPCSRPLTKEEVEGAYEAETGNVIIETVPPARAGEIPACLVCGHGPFTWGSTPEKAVENAVTLESVAKMAFGTLLLSPDCGGVPSYLLDKHYLRKHGKNAYYGQN